jgi:DEAD/DEAH box helicase domain-containing protein
VGARRAPRRGLACYVAGEDALDQFFARHTEDFLDRPVESAILDHESEEIHLAHLLCAAHEGPLSERDSRVVRTAHARPPRAPRGPRRAARQRTGGSSCARRERYPAGEVSLRSASPDSFAIVESPPARLLGTTEFARAFSTLHPGAIYLHMGRSFQVRELDLDARRALVEPFDGDWYTQPKRETDTLIERLLDRRDTLGVTLSFGACS